MGEDRPEPLDAIGGRSGMTGLVCREGGGGLVSSGTARLQSHRGWEPAVGVLPRPGSAAGRAPELSVMSLPHDWTETYDF